MNFTLLKTMVDELNSTNSTKDKQEILKKKNELAINQKELIFDDWSNIKKKNLKEILIEKYAIEMGKKHNLSIKETKYLVSIIFIAFIFKALFPNDIIMKNGKIENINGIEFENGKVSVKRDIYSIDSTNVSTSIIIDKPYMSDEWEKYLNGLRKL
mgnify:CR=1 FL=1